MMQRMWRTPGDTGDGGLLASRAATTTTWLPPHLQTSDGRATVTAYAQPRPQPLPCLATSRQTEGTDDCASSTALMVYRGLGAGLAWTIAVDMYTLLSASDSAWRQHLSSLPPSTSLSPSAPSPSPSRPREFASLLARAALRNSATFGGFLAVFGGMTCSLRTVRRRDDAINPFVGGFCSALVILPREVTRKPAYAAMGASLCGGAAMWLYQFFPRE